MTDRTRDLSPDNTENPPVDHAAAIFESSRHAVVNIVATHNKDGRPVMGSSGSGAFIRTSTDNALPRCEVVTDNHVISINPKYQVDLKVKLDDGTTHSAKLVEQDLANDLAVLKLEGVADPEKVCKPLVLDESLLEQEELTVRINRSMQKPEFNTGRYLGTIARYQRNLPPLPGENINREFLVLNTFHSLGHQFSGSPVMNLENKVIGIHVAGGNSEHESLATPAFAVRNLLNQIHSK